jgi:lipopolysaccharide/colanic/teichoic acid biosynthesis glycosyltransferase
MNIEQIAIELVRQSGRLFLYKKECAYPDGSFFYKLKTMKRGFNVRDDIKESDLDSYGKVKCDDGVTLIGRFLRAWHIDELPELVYHFPRGELKLVGVRPTSQHVFRLIPADLQKAVVEHQPKPGLCGFQYAHRKTPFFRDYISNLEKYLESYRSDPQGTDEKYFNMLLRNLITFRNISS